MKNKLRTLTALLLALCLVLSLAACGGKTEAPAADTPAADTPAAEPAAPADEPAEPVVEPIDIVMSTSKNETESGGAFLAYFCDYAEDASGGAITFTRYFGGTLAGTAEELAMVSSGAVGVTALNHTAFADALPLLQFPEVGFSSIEDCVSYYKHILFENEETSAMLADEAAANGIKYLGFFAGGTRVWFSKTEIDSLAAGAGLKFGGMSGMALMEQLGFSTVSMVPPECYENLSRGVCDLAGLTLTASVDLMWYEVAPYCVIYGAYSCGNPITINLELWNSLSEAQQQILIEAGEAAIAHSMEYCIENDSAYIDRLENELDATVIFFDEENVNTYKDAAVKTNSLDAYTRAQNQGIADKMQVILQAGADYWGTDISSIF